MGDLTIYLLVSLAVSIGAYMLWRSLIISFAVIVAGTAIALIMYYGAIYSAATSTEIWNGQVTGKKRVYDPYDESYECGKDSKGNIKWCTREVPRWRFDIESNAGKTWYAYRESKNDVPRIYLNAESGEPFATTRAFQNYQYASQQQIHVNKLNEYAGWLPNYPEIYNGFKVDHALSNGINVNNLNHMLAWAHKRWGPKYGINVIVCMVSDKDIGFSNALRDKWVGGRKNDAVVTIYIDDAENVKNVEVFSRSTRTKHDDTQADFNMALRESVAKVKTYEFEEIVNAIEVALPLFEREDLKQYDYLAADYEAPLGLVILGVIVEIFLCGAVAYGLREKFELGR